MSAYPALQSLRSTQTERNSGHEPKRATNGTLKVRRLFTAEKTDFRIEHLLDSAQKTTLENFYQANKDANVDFTGPEDGATYVVCFVAPPLYRKTGLRWLASVRLSEV